MWLLTPDSSLNHKLKRLVSSKVIGVSHILILKLSPTGTFKNLRNKGLLSASPCIVISQLWKNKSDQSREGMIEGYQTEGQWWIPGKNIAPGKSPEGVLFLCLLRKGNRSVR